MINYVRCQLIKQLKLNGTPAHEASEYDHTLAQMPLQ